MRDPFLHALDHVHGVLAGTHDDGSTDDLFALHVERAAAEVASHLHRGEVAEVDGDAVALAEDDLLDVGNGIGRLHKPEAAHDEFHAVLFDHLAADVEVAFLDGLHDLLQRDAGGAHPGGRDLDLILPHETADASDFGDAWRGVELVADEPVLQRAQLAEVVAAFGRPGRVDREVVLIDPTEARGVGSKLRDYAGGHLEGDQVESFQFAPTSVHSRPRVEPSARPRTGSSGNPGAKYRREVKLSLPGRREAA